MSIAPFELSVFMMVRSLFLRMESARLRSILS